MDVLRRFKKYLADRKASIILNSRKERIAKLCGCICYCPHCKDILNDQADCYEGDRITTYRCNTCGKISKWKFGVAPVPIIVK